MSENYTGMHNHSTLGTTELTVLSCLFCLSLRTAQWPVLFKTTSSTSWSVDIQGISAPPQPGRSWTESGLGLWLHPQDPVHMPKDCHGCPHKGWCWLVLMSVMHGQGQCEDKQLAADLLHPSYPRDHRECSSVPIFYPWLDQLGSGAILHTVAVTPCCVSPHLLSLVALSSMTVLRVFHLTGFLVFIHHYLLLLNMLVFPAVHFCRQLNITM